jgi:predicted NBD/HSP70 family sugar kinase
MMATQFTPAPRATRWPSVGVWRQIGQQPRTYHSWMDAERVQWLREASAEMEELAESVGGARGKQLRAGLANIVAALRPEVR